MTTAGERGPRWARTLLVVGAVGVAVYVGSWFIAGLLRDGYDPLRQAISELFALGAPQPSRTILQAGLGLSALALVVAGPALHAALPGRDRPAARLGPALVTLSGLMTIGVLAAPCSPGCPGFGTTATDSWHVVTAGLGYLTLMLGPLVLAHRLADDAPALARSARWLCGLALSGFLVRNVGSVDTLPGLQQRVFNTLADAWYVHAAIWAVHTQPASVGTTLGSRSAPPRVAGGP